MQANPFHTPHSISHFELLGLVIQMVTINGKCFHVVKYRGNMMLCKSKYFKNIWKTMCPSNKKYSKRMSNFCSLGSHFSVTLILGLITFLLTSVMWLLLNCFHWKGFICAGTDCTKWLFGLDSPSLDCLFFLCKLCGMMLRKLACASSEERSRQLCGTEWRRKRFSTAQYAKEFCSLK